MLPWENQTQVDLDQMEHGMANMIWNFTQTFEVWGLTSCLMGRHCTSRPPAAPANMDPCPENLLKLWKYAKPQLWTILIEMLIWQVLRVSSSPSSPACGRYQNVPPCCSLTAQHGQNNLPRLENISLFGWILFFSSTLWFCRHHNVKIIQF